MALSNSKEEKLDEVERALIRIINSSDTDVAYETSLHLKEYRKYYKVDLDG